MQVINMLIEHDSQIFRENILFIFWKHLNEVLFHSVKLAKNHTSVLSRWYFLWLFFVYKHTFYKTASAFDDILTCQGP